MCSLDKNSTEEKHAELRNCPSIHPLLKGRWHRGLGCEPIAGHNRTHFGQFGSADQPTTQAFGLEDETSEALEVRGKRPSEPLSPSVI